MLIEHTLNIDYLMEKTNLENYLFLYYYLRWMGFLLTSLKTLRWIYRSAEIEWLKENQVKHIAPPPTGWVLTTNIPPV